MIVNFSNIDQHDRPILILKRADETPIGVLGYAVDVELDAHYNELSVLNFRLPAYVDGVEVPFYDELTGFKIIELQGIAQFVLDKPVESGSAQNVSKSVSAYSLENEFARKKITLPESTYKFFDPVSPDGTVLGTIMEMMPSWHIGAVPSAVANKYRTFDENNTNLYSFMIDTVQQSYNCIFEFDTLTRTVNVRDASGSTSQKQVYISRDNLAKDIEVEEDTQGIVTRLDVSGADGVDIRDVNPTGTNKIINLDYFMTTDNFSQALVTKYNSWKQLIDTNKQPFYNYAVQYSVLVAQEVTERAKLADLQGEYTSLENVQNTIIQGIASDLRTQADLDAVNANLTAKRAEITAKQAEIDGVVSDKNDTMALMTAIRNACAYDSYFTAAERTAMDAYIKDDEIADASFVASEYQTYTDGAGNKLSSAVATITGGEISTATTSSGSTLYNINGGSLAVGGIITGHVISAVFERRTSGKVVASIYAGNGSYTGSTFPSACITISGEGTVRKSGSNLTYTISNAYMYFSLNASDYEKKTVAWDLYAYGEEVLRKLSSPSYTFSVDSANFIALNDFEKFKNELELGQKVYIGISKDKILMPICIGANIRYNDRTYLKLEFSDTFTATDSTFKLADILGNSVSMGKTFNTGKYTYSAFTESGASTGIRQFIESALDTAKNAIISSSDQAVSWDGAGLRLRKWSNQNHTAYDPEQIWMSNNSITMTEDGWSTAKMAIGKFYDTNLGNCWGIVAPMVVGTLLAGSELVIESAKKSGGTSVFRVDSDGCRLYNSEFRIMKTNSNNTTTEVLLDPEVGIALGQYPLLTQQGEIDTANARMWVDTNGTMHLSGTIIAHDGDVGGWVIAPNNLHSGSGSGYVALSTDPNSNYRIWAGAEDPGSAKFYVQKSGFMYSSSGRVGGWYIGTNYIGNASTSANSTVGLYSTTTTGAVAIWAGGARASAPFRVTVGGALTATNATITGGSAGGWVIKSDYIGSADTKAASSVGLANVSGTGIAIWAGNTANNVSTAAFRVRADGAVFASNLSISGGSITIGDKFSVDSDGTMNATGGTFNGDVTATSFTLTGSAMPPSYIQGLVDAGVAYSYAVSTSGTTAPSSGWSSTRPTSVDQGKYVWTKIVTTQLNGNTTTAYAVEYYSKDGRQGEDGIYVTSILPLYNLATSAPSTPTTSTSIKTTDVKGQWTTVVPTWASGYTYYRSAKYTYNDGTIAFATRYIDNGLTVANSKATQASTDAATAAATVDPFTYDGLSYGLTWGNVNYGVVLSGNSNAKPILIGSNAGITIAKSATNSDGAALVMNKTGIALHGASITLTTASDKSTSVVSIDPDGIVIATGGTFDVRTGTFGIASNGKDGSEYVIWSGAETAGSSLFWVKNTGEMKATLGTIGGWKIGSNYFGNATTKANSTVGFAASTTATDIVLWAGNKTAGSSNFYVTAGGSITAKSGSIAGWNFGSNYFGNAATKANSTVGMSASTTSTDVVIWAGNKTPASANFYVTAAGKLHCSDIDVTGGGININSGVFKVESDGTMTAKSGLVGGWSVTSDWLNTGTGANHVCLNGVGTYAQTWAMWCGADWPESRPTGVSTGTQNAPFRVSRTGDVYINSLKVWNGTTWETIDFSGNFSNAVSLSAGGSWSGDRFTATVSLWGKINKSITMTGTVAVTNAVVDDSMYNDQYAVINVTLSHTVNGSSKTGITTSFPQVYVRGIAVRGWQKAIGLVNYNAGETTVTVPSGTYGNTAPLDISATRTTGWNDGYDIARGYVSMPGSGSGTSFTVKVPKADRTGNESRTFTLTKGTPSASGGYASVSYNSQAVAKISLDDWWSGGRDSVTVSAAGWQNGANRVSASNGKSYVDVTLPSFTTSQDTGFTDHKINVYFKTASVGAALATAEVNATTEYNAGVTAGNTAGYNSAKLAGSWDGAVWTVTKGTTGSNSVSLTLSARAAISYDETTHKYTATGYARAFNSNRATSDPVPSGTEAYDAGVTAGTTAGYNSAKLAGSWSGKRWLVTKGTTGTNQVGITISATISYDTTTHKYTAKANADGSLIDSMESGTQAYSAGTTAGYNSAKVKGAWDGNVWTVSKVSSGSTSDSVNTTVTAAATISYDSTTHKYTATAKASAGGAVRETKTKDSGTEAYEAGYGAGWAAAAAKFKRTGNTVYGPSTTADGSDRSFTANYTASTCTPSSYTESQYSSSWYRASRHSYTASTYTPSSATKIASNMWQNYVASKYSQETHDYLASAYIASEFTKESYTAESYNPSSFSWSS